MHRNRFWLKLLAIAVLVVGGRLMHSAINRPSSQVVHLAASETPASPLESGPIDDALELPVVESHSIDDALELPVVESHSIDDSLELWTIESQRVIAMLEPPVVEFQHLIDTTELSTVTSHSALELTELSDSELLLRPIYTCLPIDSSSFEQPYHIAIEQPYLIDMPPPDEIIRYPVSSTVFESVGYDLVNQVLEVEFHSGAVYRYYHVPYYEYEAFINAPSLGQHYNMFIKGIYLSQQVL